MKNKFERHEIVRRTVGAILASSLTSQEIKMLAIEMSHGDISHQISKKLFDYLLMFDLQTKENFETEEFSEPTWVDMAAKLVSEKKIIKKELIALIASLRPLNVSHNTLLKMTNSEILARSFDGASNNQKELFLKKLRSITSLDPYLLGIERR